MARVPWLLREALAAQKGGGQGGQGEGEDERRTNETKVKKERGPGIDHSACDHDSDYVLLVANMIMTITLIM